MRTTRRITNIGTGPACEVIQRELGSGIRPIFTHTATGVTWCELRLPASRFMRANVCSPGESKDKALKHAISAAKKQRKAEAA